MVDSDGRRAAQERFCADAWRPLVAAVSHHCGDVHLAEELVQEALVRACRRWTEVSRLASPIGWTYRVAVNLSTSAWRRRQAEQRARVRHGVASDRHEDVDTAERLAVRDALATLTDRQREAVVLRHLLDLSAEQVAVLTGSTPGAVRGLTHRAVAQLRDALDVTVPPTEEVADVP